MIIYPVIALVGLTGYIWVLMYVRRISEMTKEKINPQSLATREMASSKLKNTSAADNFRNLLEVPVLFYVLCLILFVMNEVTQLQLFLAWLYVVLRAIHSLIHVTYNKVIHRFAVHFVSTICLFMMWGNFAIFMLAQNVT